VSPAYSSFQLRINYIIHDDVYIVYNVSALSSLIQAIAKLLRNDKKNPSLIKVKDYLYIST
ncbi:hypothetical protein ABWK24_09590, partial [Priestia megaterium]|uniref:hypothetical protein n=1 Tax=Priestia megaterium TaxID=1404 RepID=UPI003398C74C